MSRDDGPEFTTGSPVAPRARFGRSLALVIVPPLALFCLTVALPDWQHSSGNFNLAMLMVAVIACIFVQIVGLYFLLRLTFSTSRSIAVALFGIPLAISLIAFMIRVAMLLVKRM